MCDLARLAIDKADLLAATRRQHALRCIRFERTHAYGNAREILFGALMAPEELHGLERVFRLHEFGEVLGQVRLQALLG